MAIDSNSVTIDSNSYAIYIPMVQHQVIQKCDKLPFLRAVSHRLAWDRWDEDLARVAHKFNLWVSIDPSRHLLCSAGLEAPAHDENECDRDHDNGRSIANAGIERRPD